MKSYIPTSRIEKKTFCLAMILFMTFFGLSAQETTDQDAWPKKVEGEKGKVVVYQPQVESFIEDKLEARAAVSVATVDNPSPVFGAMWFDCRVSTDRDERTVTLLEVRVISAKFPEAKQEDIDKLSKFLEEEIPRWDIVLSLDRLLVDLDLDAGTYQTTENLNNAPPEIIFRTTPTVLILIDGDPIWEETGESGLQYVLNTPFFIVRDEKKQAYYIKGGDYWYSSMDPKTGWQHIESPSKKVQQLADEYFAEEADDNSDTVATAPVVPEILVRTSPAELLQSGGEPSYEPIPGTSLLFMKNTDDDILMDIDTQDYYVLISGRWYRSKSLSDGPWTFMPPSELPEDFAEIPSDSEMAGVKSNVAGTQEAKEALLENQVPQTAEVSRADAALEVSYDGKPKFEAIEGTSMKYAVNTEKSVLQIGNKYYCCDNAVWFESDRPQGPWSVSVSVPDDVQDIPPESPVYNVKYVSVYDYTPSVVYVGYTPGYVHSYVYMGTVCYGTGYYYHPWHGAYYYPRPVTYGYNVHYNPYTGWGFSMTVSRGWFTVSYGSRPGYWGPAGYRHGYHHGYHHGYRHGYNRGAAAGYRAGYNAGQRNAASNNIYRNRSNGVSRTGDRSFNPRTGQPIAAKDATNNRQRPSKAQGANNVYTDRNGNVVRKEGNNWQSRENGQWKNQGAGSRDNRAAQPATRDVTRPAPADRSYENLNRDANSRARGSQRSSNYQQNRQNYQYQQPSGNRSGGGATRPSRGGARRR